MSPPTGSGTSPRGGVQQPPASNGHGMDGVEDFVREFKILDCACCDMPIAFQHRVSGRFYCATTTACITQQQEQRTLESRFGHGPSSSSLLVPAVGAPAPSAPKVPVIAAPTPIRAFADPPRASTTALLNATLARPGCGPNPLFKESPSIKPEVLASLLNKKPKPQDVAKPMTGKMEIQEMTGAGGGTAMGEDEHDAAAASQGRNDAGKSKATPPPPKLEKAVAVAEATAPVATPKPVMVVPRTMVPTQVRTTVAKRATPPAPPPSPKRFMWADCSFSTKLRDGSIVKASFVYNVNKLHVCAEEDDATLADMQVDILEYITNGGAVKNSMSPVMNEMVLAEYQGEHYRARVVDVSAEADGKCTLLFVDFGDTATKRDYKDCYQITSEFMKVPIMGVPLLLPGIPSVNMETFSMGGRMEQLVYSRVVLKLLEPLEMGNKDTFKAELTSTINNTTLNKILATVVTKMELATTTNTGGDDE